MEEKLEYRLTYLTETLEDMKREMIRIRTIISNSRKTHYTNQESYGVAANNFSHIEEVERQ